VQWKFPEIRAIIHVQKSKQLQKEADIMSKKTYIPRSCGECMYVVWPGRAGDNSADTGTGKRCSACYFRRTEKAKTDDEDPNIPFAG
jgi:hypothetical protein